MKEIPLLDMLKSGVHFGHQKRRWHPKMKPYIHTSRSGIYIIDLEKTAEKLKEACDFISETVSTGGKILFVATKRQAQTIVQEAAREAGMLFVTERWIGGTLTNFENISKLIRRLKDLRSKKQKGELDKYTKREQLQFTEEIEYLEKLVGGIEQMEKLPQALFVVDVRKEKTAVREARKKKIPVIAMVDTNCNPDLIDYPIPANDDAIKAIKIIISAVLDSIITTEVKKPEPQAEQPKPAESEGKQEKASVTNDKDKK